MLMDTKTVFELKALTPLWTGDVDRDSAMARESGLIGSLRFWYEGLLRSLDLDACDPVEDRRCDGEQFCEACALFGATGRARRFRLEVDGLQPTELFFRASREVAVPTKAWLSRVFAPDRAGITEAHPGKSGQFRFGVRALWTPATFRITVWPRREDRRWNGPVAALVALALSEAAEYGGIGAKTQNGFGQVKLVSPVGSEIQVLIQQARDFLRESGRPGAADARLFTLSEERFFCQLYDNIQPTTMEKIGQPPPEYVQAQEPYIPCAFDIRYKSAPESGLRPALQTAFSRSVAREMLGSLKGADASASRIHVSHLFREQPHSPYKLKIWGDVRRKDLVKPVISEYISKRRFPGATVTELRG